MEDILKEVEKNLNITITEKKQLKGSTDSIVMLINNCYILKIDQPNYISETINFLQSCKSPAFTKLMYYSKDKSFLVYKYIEGTKLDTLKNINIMTLLKELYNITLSYPKSNDLCGHIAYKFDSWIEYLKDDMNYCKEHIPCLNEIDFQLINLEINNLTRFEYDKVIMHGDFGTHNFIFKDNKLAGIIDPQPIVGDGLYDYFFACLSNVSILQSVTLDEIFSIPNAPTSKMKSLFLIALYNRIQRCIKHHPNDLDYYLNLFNSIKKEDYHYYINNFI